MSRDFARAASRKASLTKFLDSLPKILAAQDLRDLLSAIHRARVNKKAPFSGGSAVTSSKLASAPVLIDLMRRGFVSGIAMNGAALIHDFEIAMAGNTSEDVEAALGKGHFGMAEETGILHQRNCQAGLPHPHWLWRSCRTIPDQRHPFAQASAVQRFVEAYKTQNPRHRSSRHRHGHTPHASRGRWCRARLRHFLRFPPLLRSGASKWMPAACFSTGALPCFSPKFS